MRSAKQEGGSTGGRCAAASSSKGPRKQPVGRPKNKPSAEPLVRRDPDRICLDDGRAFLAGSISQEIESGREEKAAARARADPAGQREAEGIPSHFCLLLSFVCCSQKSIAEPQRNKSLCFSTQYCLKRNTRAAATTAGEQGEAATTAPAKEGGKRENKAAGAHAAACVLVLTAEAGIFFACGEH